MEEKNLDEIMESINNLKNMTKGLTKELQEELGADTAQESLPELDKLRDGTLEGKSHLLLQEYEEKIRNFEHQIIFIESKLKNSVLEKDTLQSQAEELLKEIEQLHERIASLETINSELGAKSQSLSDTLDTYQHSRWIKFSMDLINQFVAEFSRYFRNPKGMGKEAMQMCISAAGKNEALVKKIKVVENELQKFENLLLEIKQKFVFSHPVARQLNLNAAIEKLLAKTISQGKADIKINAKYMSENIQVSFDEKMLEEILNNILTNALESITGQGVINITVKESDGTAYIEVVDTGYGFVPHLLEKIFAPFVTTKKGHTGLGLTKAYWLAQMNHSKIEIANDETKGAKVIVSIPLIFEVQKWQ